MTESRLSEEADEVPGRAPDMPDSAGTGREAPRSILRMVLAFLVLTALAAGAGTLAGLHLAENVRAEVEARAVDEEEPPAPNPDYAAGMISHDVPAVVANLAAPSDVWIRIESSIIFSDAEIARPDILAGEIAQDMLAYLRTVSLAEIEGPSGLLHLREDLSDRVAIRSNGSVRELIIETMVVQ